MALLIGFDPSGVEPRTAHEIENIVAALQTWAGKVDGINAQGLANVVPVGSMSLWGASTAPAGYLLCDGTAVSRGTYSALFTVLGTTYGVGDGSSTFNVPDLRQRFPIGKAAAGTGSSLGATGGAIDHTHTLSTDGSHSHTGSTGSVGGHTHTFTTGTGTTAILDYQTGGVGAASKTDHVHNGTTDSGGGHSHSISADGSHTHTAGANNPPFVVVNYIIKT